MSRYLIEVQQIIITPLTVDADSIVDAQKRALYGFGELGDQIYSEPEIVVARPLEHDSGDQ